MLKKLFIPGPVDVSEDVLQQLSKPMIGHRGKNFSELLESCVKNLKRLMFTENHVLITTSSATGLMEAAILNCVKKKCLNFSCGGFGEKWHEVTKACGKEANLIKLEWGEAITPEIVDKELSKEEYDAITLVHNETTTGVTNPLYEISEVVKNYDAFFFLDTVSSMGGIKVEVDKLSIDVCLFGLQKCLALPPGLGICSVSERVLERSKAMKNKGYYFDFSVLQESMKKLETPTTPAISLLYALDYQLKKILDKEGLENRYKRHEDMSKLTRKWVKENDFELLPKEMYSSNTVTCVKNTRNINLEDMKKKLSDKGYVSDIGYGKLKGKVFRVAHMGDRTLAELQEYLSTIDGILGF